MDQITNFVRNTKKLKLLFLMSKEIDDWINDELHTVIGMSDKTLVDYIKTSGTISFNKASSSKSKEKLIKDLEAIDFPAANQEHSAFINRLYDVFSSKGSKLSV